MGSAALNTPLSPAFEIMVTKTVVLHSHCSNIAQRCLLRLRLQRTFPQVTGDSLGKCLLCQPEGKGISLPFLNSAREATVNKEQM